MSEPRNWPNAHALSFGAWVASIDAIESDYDLVLRWAVIHENHGYAGGRVDAIAHRFPLPRAPYRPIVDITPRQLTLEVA